MNEKIKNILLLYCKNNNIEIDIKNPKEVLEFLNWNFAKLYEETVSNHRWWNTVQRVIEVNGMYVSYNDAETTGDDSAYDIGWEFDLNTIKEVEPYEEKIIRYRRKN